MYIYREKNSFFIYWYRAQFACVRFAAFFSIQLQPKPITSPIRNAVHFQLQFQLSHKIMNFSFFFSRQKVFTIYVCLFCVFFGYCIYYLLRYLRPLSQNSSLINIFSLLSFLTQNFRTKKIASDVAFLFSRFRDLHTSYMRQSVSQ